MKPGFALSLSFGGISLLHQTTDGWQSVGDIAPDSPDLTGDLARLRAAAEQRAPGDVTCQIVIPNDQIRYITVQSDGLSGDALEQMVRAALDGVTPYAVADLVFDLSIDGMQTHVAAVARESLAEAELFATDHNFNPLCFVATPPDGAFPGPVSFGETNFAQTRPTPKPTLAPEVKLTSASATSEPGESDAPADDIPETSAPNSETDPEISKASHAATGEQSAPALGGFHSRRRKTTKAEPTYSPPLAGASRSTDIPPAPETLLDPDPEPTPPETPALSVTDPHLDAPEPTELADLTEPTTAKPETADTAPSKPSEPSEPLKVSEDPETPAPKPAAKPLMLHPSTMTTATATASLAPEDEAARMTVFGARQPTKTQGKSRLLGLTVTVVLLIGLSLVAAWAMLVSNKDLARQIFDLPDETELAAEPDLVDNDTDAGPLAPIDGQTSTQTDTATLTDADSAVLDAMRNTQDVPIAPLTKAEAEARYAATGIWPWAPAITEPPAINGLDDLYVASIDRTDLSQDAVALPPAPDQPTDQVPKTVLSPTAAGTTFALNDRGLVIATAAGALSPDGVVVYLGRPAAVPPRTPTRFETAPEQDVLRDRLADLRPRLRPDDLVENAERSRLGGLSRAELGTLRPKIRPRTQKQIAEEDETPTAHAVVVSLVPRQRPAGFARIVQKTQETQEKTASTQPTQVATIAPRAVTPKIPSSASVARQATLEKAINLRRVNLIGVFGTKSDRRALVRLPSGRYKKVEVGDTIDGGRVLAIGDSELRYQKSGRNVTLKMPKG